MSDAQTPHTAGSSAVEWLVAAGVLVALATLIPAWAALALVFCAWLARGAWQGSWRERKLLGGLVCSLLLFNAISSGPAFLLGGSSALLDAAAGRQLRYSYGMPSSLGVRTWDVLRERHRIETRSWGCCVTPGIIGFSGGYNTVAEPLIRLRHGADVFERARAEAAREEEEIRELEALRSDRAAREGG